MRELPKLKTPRLTSLIRSNVGGFKNVHETCPAKELCTRDCHGELGGSTIKCQMQACFRDCNNCAGSFIYDHADESALLTSGVPGVCGKSPLKDLFFNLVHRDSYDVVPQDRLEFENKAILLTNGRAGENTIYADATSVVAVNIRHVVTAKGGWRAENIRDYLKLPDNKTLVMLTSMTDEFLESFWRTEFSFLDYAKAGFDFWQPLDFSVYTDTGNLNAIFSWMRSTCELVDCKGHFTPLPPILRMSTQGQDLAIEVLRKVPNISFSIQSVGMNLRTKSNVELFKLIVLSLRRLRKLAAVPLSVWIVGVNSPAVVYNFKKSLPDLDLYFVSSVAWQSSHKGRALGLDGKVTARLGVPKKELVLQNQKTYRKLVESAIRAAS